MQLRQMDKSFTFETFTAVFDRMQEFVRTKAQTLELELVLERERLEKLQSESKGGGSMQDEAD